MCMNRRKWPGMKKIYIVVDSEEHFYVNNLYSQSPPDKVLTMQVCMMSSLSATRNTATRKLVPTTK